MWAVKELMLAVATYLTGKELQLIIQQTSPIETFPGSDDDARYSPPFYPSPWMTGQGEWADAYTKAREFVSQLTLLEKVNLTTGVGWEGEQCVGQVDFLVMTSAKHYSLMASRLAPFLA